MTRADLADGANVLQKGYSVGGGSQYKLQVDHLLGHPSCVIAGQRHRIYRAEPWIDVADGRWHNLVCTRNADRLVMTVDGVDRAWVRVPPRLSIANPEPLRVGGKGPAGQRPVRRRDRRRLRHRRLSLLARTVSRIRRALFDSGCLLFRAGHVRAQGQRGGP